METLEALETLNNLQRILLLVAALGGVVFGYFFHYWTESRKVGSAREIADRIIENAQKEAELKKREALLEAADAGRKERDALERELSARRREVEEAEKKVRDREAEVARRADLIAKEAKDIAVKEEVLAAEGRRLAEEKKEVQRKVEALAGMTAAEAKRELVASIEAEARAEAARTVRRVEEEARREAKERAGRIVTIALERLAAEVASEKTVASVALPSDDMKGRIIGREGRNIREFERLTGTDLVIDDTPEAVVISCYDPIRREVARLALTRLVADGRIHPARIEEMVARAQREVEDSIVKFGEEAAYALGIHNLRAEVIALLGRLKYRTSYGQNVLDHSVEVARIGALLAAEIGLDVPTVKRACLLHDIGKALSQEFEGPHAVVGAEFLKRHGEPPAVVAAVEGHHGEVPEQSVEAMIVQAADAISGARPGARLEQVELYVKRLEDLERIATREKGVERAYAIQAGREVRVIVQNDEVDDDGAVEVAKRIARRIEEEIQYPGQIKVTVIRETRVVDYAR